LNRLKARFEEKKNDVLPGTIIMISGCEDDQTSADVSDVASFKLPDPVGRAGGGLAPRLSCRFAMLTIENVMLT